MWLGLIIDQARPRQLLQPARRPPAVPQRMAKQPLAARWLTTISTNNILCKHRLAEHTIYKPLPNNRHS